MFLPGAPHRTLPHPNTMWRLDGERRVYHKRKAFGGDGTPAVDVDAFRSTFDSCYLWEITIEFVIVTSSLSFLGLFCRPFPNV